MKNLFSSCFPLSSNDSTPHSTSEYSLPFSLKKPKSKLPFQTSLRGM